MDSQIIQKKFDSNFTFFRGALRSQVDLVISNKVHDINSFNIMNKVIYSDHCPFILCCSTNILPDLHLLRNCIGLFSYVILIEDLNLQSIYQNFISQMLLPLLMNLLIN